MVKPIIYAALLTASSVAWTQTNTCTVDTTNTDTVKMTNIYFINGINTTITVANAYTRLLKKAYMENLARDYPDQKFIFELSYNHTRGLILDLSESLKQKSIELGMLTVNFGYGIYIRLNRLLKGEMQPNDQQLMQIIVDAEVSRTLALMRASILASSHTQKFRKALLAGKRVILIPHSQGNLFANEALLSLRNEEYFTSIRAIGVASPASIVVDSSTYWTAKDDLVINGLRVLSSNTLAGNIDNDPGLFFNDHRDILNHAFDRSYLEDGLASRTKIDRDFYNNIRGIQFPLLTAKLGSGDITISLEWGREPDVDLHVYEPNGDHVYYNNKRGTSGELDRDDISSFGPEHYYVPCNTLEVGTYRVGVDYYSGSGIETARVQIATGDGRSQTFTQLLLSDTESSTNSPIIIATVIVRKDSDGRYTYTVRAN